jgi:diguanylate cyclase (GGDEF)-like protein/PAS domain S-box-containing protein
MSAASIEMDGTSCVLFFVRDIDAAKKAEARLAAAAHATSQSEHRYRTVFETSPDSVMITRLEDATVVDVNRTFCQNSGYERTEIVGRKLLDFDHWVDPVERQNMVDLVRRNGSCRDFETRFYTKDRSIHWGLISASTFDLDGEACLLSITRDITDAKENEKKIRKLSFYDPLTNLPNRRLLLEKLRRSLVSVGAKRNRNALILIGLDRFKIVNETLGHPVGDLLLQEVARRMTSCVKNANTIARIGGDEFVVLLRDLSENTEEAASQAKDVSYKILVEISRTYTLGKLNSRCTASIGITIFAEEENAKELLQQVDIAMVQAKAAGRNTMRFFAPHLQAAVNARATMEEDLREAIGTSQFMLYYQPQVENGRVTGAEALVRWKHPSKGFLSPAAFIPLAEETGLILPLGDWVLESACRKIAEWEGHPTASQISVSVNISARQLRQHDFVEQVLSVLERTGANPKRLMLELTESMLVENVGEVIAKMTSLKSTGLSFSLDDFGTGYSSLSYLKRLPLNELKIDLSFVRDILVEASSGVIAETIIALSRAMGMSVIAEGVETEEQREYLARLGCHAYQGYLFSRPLPADDFERMLPESFPATATMIV